MPLTLRTGFEATPLLPPTSGRRHLAEGTARRVGGAVERVSREELSLLLGSRSSRRLARGPTVRDRDEEPACHLVGDVTASDHGRCPATLVTP